MLIDWLTLRMKLSPAKTPALYEKVMACRGLIQCWSADGEILWEKNTLDVDKLRSDTVGLVWQLQSDGRDDYLVIAASPASLQNGGVNVFGNLDIRNCAETLIQVARKALGVFLPGSISWQCRRIDITGNYLLPDSEAVKQALRELMVSDGSRRRATSAKKGGDTVTWNQTSDLSKGKAYHKGPQLRYLLNREKILIEESKLEDADRILRLEHTRAARWWRRFEEQGGHYLDLTADALIQLFTDFFGKIVTGLEYAEMNRDDIVNRIRDINCITQGRAEGAFTTLRNIREDGVDVVRGYMPRSTWQTHLRYLRRAGFTDSDIFTAKVIPFRRIKVVLAQPVMSWSEVRQVA